MGEWKHGLLGCFTNPGICCLAICGYPFLAGRQLWSGNLGYRFLNNLICVGKNAEAIGEDATFWAVVSWSPCVAALLRGQIRKKKGIEGKLWQDFCIYCCLPCCAVGQEAMELDSVGYLLDDEDLKMATTKVEPMART